MDYVRLGRSGLMVSPLCLGTMMFGDRTDAMESARIIAAARDAGVNFIDTADVYSEGLSEEITGRAIANSGHRRSIAAGVASETVLNLRPQIEDVGIHPTAGRYGPIGKAVQFFQGKALAIPAP